MNDRNRLYINNVNIHNKWYGLIVNFCNSRASNNNNAYKTNGHYSNRDVQICSCLTLEGKHAVLKIQGGGGGSVASTTLGIHRNND